MKSVASTLDEAAEFIRQERPFRLRGSGKPSLWATNEAPTHLGRIPPQHSEGVEGADYWVFSYDTVIAWVTEGEPTVPDVGYSPTTGQHQYLTAHALGTSFRPARGRDTVEIPRNDSQYGRPRRLRRGGMDGVPDDLDRPSSNVTLARESSYAGVTGDAMHWNDEGARAWGPIVRGPQGWRSRSHP